MGHVLYVLLQNLWHLLLQMRPTVKLFSLRWTHLIKSDWPLLWLDRSADVEYWYFWYHSHLVSRIPIAFCPNFCTNIPLKYFMKYTYHKCPTSHFSLPSKHLVSFVTALTTISACVPLSPPFPTTKYDVFQSSKCISGRRNSGLQSTKSNL